MAGKYWDWGHKTSSKEDKYYDDYNDDWGYGSTYKKKGKSINYSDWNWGTWGAASTVEDDDEDIFIKTHQNYFTPTQQEISWKLQYQDDTAKNRNTIREFARYFYHRMIDEKDYFKEKYADPEKISEDEVGLFHHKKTQYEELWEKFIPGYTPLEQAVSLFTELKRQAEKDHKDLDKMTQEELTEKMSAMEFHEDIFKDPIFNELLDMQELSKNNKIEVLNMISMIENLGSQFKIEKEVTEKIAHNSRLIAKKVMRDYSQLHMVDLYQRLMPTFNTKLLTKDLIINTPIEKTEHKQKIIIIIDFSGSMSYPEKQKWVLALMIDRLKYVIKEEAEVFFSFFVNRPDQLRFTHLHNRESVMKFWTSFSTSPNGGDTDIGAMIERIKDEIENKHRLCNLDIDLSEERPEVLIINDGQDSIKTKGFTYKTNAITVVDHENEELKKLCIDNDGKYVYANNSSVVTYDKGGKLVMH